MGIEKQKSLVVRQAGYRARKPGFKSKFHHVITGQLLDGLLTLCAIFSFKIQG